MTPPEPRVCAVIPAYNAAGTLEATFASLTAQSVPEWEAVLVDDGSTDATPDLAAALPNARYVEIPGNHMSAVTRPELGAAIRDFLAA